MDILYDLVRYTIFGGLLLVFLYVSVRTVSFAYFRTKYAHFRRIMKELKKGDY